MGKAMLDKPEAAPLPATRISLAETISRRVNLGCKIIALFAVLISVTWHAVKFYQPGNDSCSQLFAEGRWVKNQWQPYGCMMHHYMPSETRTCLKNNKVAIIGDSRLRALFFQLSGSLSGRKLKNEKVHSNLHYTEPQNISVNFYWHPEASDSMQKLFQSWLKKEDDLPRLIIAGAGVWTIKKSSLKAVIPYQESVGKIGKLLTKILGVLKSQSNSSYWVANKPKAPNFVSKQQKRILKKQWLKTDPQVIWMMQDPVVEAKLNRFRKPITNEKIELFNLAAVKALESSSVQVLNASNEMAAAKPEETEDGLHFSPKIVDMQLNLILNSFCNRYMVPSDASCCMEMEKITKLQYNTMAVFTTCMVLCAVVFIMRRCIHCHADKETVTQPGLTWIHSDQTYSVLKAMTKLGFIMAYFFLCDRSYIFMKEHKDYSLVKFLIPLGVFFCLGAFSKTGKTSERELLNEDQLDEWKGWMMLTILVYNYTGAEKVLSIFLFIEVLFASYLFIIGFENFLHYWNTGDFGLFRVCQVLAKLNIICVAVCLFMDRPYQFYYFTPILSIWFMFLYLMMIFPPRLTSNYVAENIKNYIWVMVKFGLLFALIFIIWGNETVCNWLFSRFAIKELFVDTNDSVHEWTLKSGRDRYIVLYGMFAAFTYVTAKKYNIICEDIGNKFLFKKRSTIAVLFLSLVGISLFAVHLFVCNHRSVCNAAHAAASCIPITSYVLLRNVPEFLRIRFSSFFAWIGKMSIELYIAQYHIWLAADSHGLLVLVPNYPSINALLTTFVFVCIVIELKDISGALSDALVTKDVRVMLRRLVIFILMLNIIWWHKTHVQKPLPS